MSPAARPAMRPSWPYPPAAYDDHWRLKPSCFTLIVWLSSVRHLLLVLIVFFPIMPGREQMLILRDWLTVPMTVAELPALLLLIAHPPVDAEPGSGLGCDGSWLTKPGATRRIATGDMTFPCGRKDFGTSRCEEYFYQDRTDGLPRFETAADLRDRLCTMTYV